MKNHIWVGGNFNGLTIVSFVKIELTKDGHFKGNISSDKYAHCEGNTFGINVKRGEVIELIYDSETGKVTVVKPREIGWYVTKYGRHTPPMNRHWNGHNWCVNRATNEPRYDNSVVKVLSEKLPFIEYYAGLE